MLFSKRAEYELVYLLKPQANHSIDTLSCNYRGKKTMIWTGYSSECVCLMLPTNLLN